MAKSPVNNEINKGLSNYTTVSSFYEGRSVFVTGATGFLGTVLVEKLLFSCDGIKNIYVLVKQKAGKRIEERLRNYLDSQAFLRIKDSKPDSLKKIIAIEGNLLDDNLGLRDEDIELLQKEVSIVFHSAANVSFDMTLKKAIEINTKPTEKLLKICENMQRLVAFVYISTAYSHCNRKVVDERVYKTDLPLETVYKLMEVEDTKGLIEYLLDGRPNTYTYSKALCEELIQSRAHIIPAVIVRPSIIVSSVKEPFPGWVAGWSGQNGVVHACGQGLIKCWYGEPTNTFDIIPVDTVVNVIITSAWDYNVKRGNNKKELKVYNCCASLQNPTDVGSFLGITVKHNHKHFARVSNTNTILIMRNSYIVYSILYFFLHTIPALIVDFLLLITLRKPRMMKIQKKMSRMANVLHFFTVNKFLFVNYNVRELHQRLSETDRAEFDLDFTKIEWDAFLETYVLGLKKYNV